MRRIFIAIAWVCFVASTAAAQTKFAATALCGQPDTLHTLPIGDLRESGMPSADLQPDGSGLSPATGLSLADETTPAHLTTRSSGALTGQPVTGPITSAFATLVSNDFPVGKIDPNTPPSPDAPGAGTTAPDQLCSPSNASLLNGLIGLPSPSGKNIFYAPGTFAVHTSA